LVLKGNSDYGANRIKRVPVLLQNIMLYVIRVGVPNYAKMYPEGLWFKSDPNLVFSYYFKYFDIIEIMIISY